MEPWRSKRRLVKGERWRDNEQGAYLTHGALGLSVLSLDGFDGRETVKTALVTVSHRPLSVLRIVASVGGHAAQTLTCLKG